MRSSSFIRILGRSNHRRFSVVVLIALLAAIVIGGCSSAPDTPEHEVTRKNQAARYAEFGNAQFNLGNYNLALRYFDLALAENVAVDHLPGIARSYNSIGRVYSAAGNPSEARSNFQSAIQFADLADDSEIRMQAHVNLGVVALQEDDTDEAMRYFGLAEAAVESQAAKPNAILFHSLGTLYARRSMFLEAQQYLERARDLNREERRWSELASNHYMLASVASRQGRFELAYQEATRALAYDKRAENSPGIAADLHALGTISSRMNNDEAAYQYLLRSLRVYLTLNQPVPAMTILGQLEETARRTGREAEAVEFRSQRLRLQEALQPERVNRP